MAAVIQQDQNLRLVESESVYTCWVAMNVQKPPFTDVRVRQALNYAIDKEAIIKTLLRDHAKLADSPLAPRVWWYTPVKSYPYDPAKAKALLAEAGYPTGLPNKVLLRSVARTDAKEVMVALQGQLKQVGVDVGSSRCPWPRSGSSSRPWRRTGGNWTSPASPPPPAMPTGASAPS